jgi:hypothetical protein
MAMSTDLKDYARVYDFLDKDDCKKIISALKKEKEWKTHSYYDVIKDTTESYEDDFQITYGAKDETKFVMDKLWHSINYYVRMDIKCRDWFDNWSGYSPIRWNKYKTGTRMQTHCDHIQTMFDGTRKGIPILTILGLLNDNYKGGELILWEDQTIEMKPGQIIIFPSNFLYPHKVNPVTKGIRYSFVSWVW